MARTPIRFDDGAGYEQMMGVWSRLAGEDFIKWLQPKPGLQWIDIGCGNGVSTAMIVELCSPSAIQGVDPSEALLAYARSRLPGGVATFRQAEGGALPFPDGSFDIAMMALVIFFLPDPAAGVAEMVRVIRPGGRVTAYAWDIPGGGFTLEPIFAAMREIGMQPTLPPNPDAARAEALRELWTQAGLVDVETRKIVVQRSFADFDDFWATSLKGPGASMGFATIAPDVFQRLKQTVQARLGADAAGRVTCTAWANAVQGRKPA
jgi:ubiquinone/menaquinone biosynthesis C-methylase UbiE